ncbi:MAG: uncharacterized protein KVP18_002329 [Porospora cf. gigantea A]|uniref:uncharacterized protein n=1 Tax=Porospora cf. gigantea A TaxID=2853593 RepID=UPI0035597D74|nr:MAG: hypothetical protein KVP18_002329 [Porospora cf. gigantea A]
MLRLKSTTTSPVKRACTTLLGSSTISANIQCLQNVPDAANAPTGIQSCAIGNWSGTAVRQMEISGRVLPAYLSDILVGLGDPNIPASLQSGVEPCLAVRDLLGLDCLRFPTPDLEYGEQYILTAARAVLGSNLADSIAVDVSVSSNIPSDQFSLTETFLCALLQLMLVLSDLEERFYKMLVAFDANSCSVTLVNDVETPITCRKQHQPRYGGAHEAKIRILESLSTDYQKVQQVYVFGRRQRNLPVSIADPQMQPSTLSAVKTLNISESSNANPQMQQSTLSTVSTVESPVKSSVKADKSSIKNVKLDRLPRGKSSFVDTSQTGNVKQAQLPRRGTVDRSSLNHLSSTGSSRSKQAQRQKYSRRVVKLSDQLYEKLRREIIPTHDHHYLPRHEEMLVCARSLESLENPTPAFGEAARRAYLKTQRTRCGVRKKAWAFFQELTSEVSSEIESL